jgi:APA family basic amino acid/polyamine antiporter
MTLVIYSAVAISALMAVGADALAESDTPLAVAVSAGSLNEAAPVVRTGATVASLGVLLSLMVGVSRTLFSMAANRDAPSFLANVHPRYKIPDRAELAVAALVIFVVALADVRGAIGFSSFGVLLYYSIANASAVTLNREERRWPRWLSVAGVIGCLVLAFSLPVESVLVGGAVAIAGCALFVAARLHGPQAQIGP